MLNYWRYQFFVYTIWAFEEYDQHGILHIHGVISVPERFYVMKLLQRGYNIHITDITDNHQWLMYASNKATNNLLNLSDDYSPMKSDLDGYTPAIKTSLFTAESAALRSLGFELS